MSEARPRIYVALPHRPGEQISFHLHRALKPHFLGDVDVEECPPLPCSMLPLSFNMMWADAYNKRKQLGLTHFCMVHSDVAPLDQGWLRMLYDEHCRVGADITSSVIALKDERGQSSTAVMNVNTREMRKLTLQECHNVGKKTFNINDLGFAGHCLLLNTGCWICDFTNPTWLRKMCFRFHDHIIYDESSDSMRAACVGEDWLFSIDAYRLGLKTFATTALVIEHQGVYQYPNIGGWGSQEKDVSFGWNIEPPVGWNWIESPKLESKP